MTQVFDVERVLAQLTLDEKASLTSGSDFWHTQPVERAGVPAIMVTDGPHGLRKQAENPDHLGIGNSVPATCFPPAAALGSSWDVDLLHRVGEALGRETRANDVAVLLGPGVNIKRTPLCGRNFEYVSEDPVVAGELGTAIVRGIQSQGVGTSLKHFAANNQETDRMRVSADIDERTLREIYLPAFERVVTNAQPWTVMCAYNKLNGTYASEHRWLLTEVLRDEWAFEGLVVSDWGAVHDRVPSLTAGLDLQMPASSAGSDEAVVAAVRDGSLDEAVLDVAVRRVLRLVERSLPGLAEDVSFDVDAHHLLAREAAADGSVLLKNDPVDGTPLLPLTGSIAVVGEFARTPRYQGAGSSQVNPTRLDDALTALGSGVPFAPAFTIAGGPSGDDDALLADAVELARTAETVVAFLGLPGPDESEGYDRPRLALPDNQVAALRAVAEVNPRIVVVLANGSAVAVSDWQHLAPAILETWLGGQAGGSAVADLLLGRRSPSGKLTETIPHRLEDTPAFGNFPGELGHVRYGEGVLVGYRWYDTRAMDVAFPFGHGLSYTTFTYDDFTATETSAQVTITNTGAVPGAEVVQVYVRDPEASVLRPTRELKAFGKVSLAPGESRTLTFDLTRRDLSFWHSDLRRWVVEGGEFVIEVGASSRDIRDSVSIQVEGDPLWSDLTAMSSIAEWFAHPVGGPLMQDALTMPADMPPMSESDQAMLAQMPAKVLVTFGMTRFTLADLDNLVAKVAAG